MYSASTHISNALDAVVPPFTEWKQSWGVQLGTTE